MPATITHAYFASDVYDLLDNNKKELLINNQKQLRMFAQSMDPIMFFNITNLKSGKDVRKFQLYFHKYKSRDYFINLVNYIKENNLQEKNDIMAFLYGSICHYSLDSIVHPFVIYKTGWFDKTNPRTYKYNNIHEFMETFIDNDMLNRRTKSNPYNFDMSTFCFDLSPFSKDLKTMLNTVFKETFDVNRMSFYYYKSLKQMRFFIKHFRRDPKGTKKAFYKFIDSFTSKRAFRLEALSYHYPLNDKHNFLNTNHGEWYNPVDPSIKSTKSFIELYLEAIEEANNIIKNVNKYFDGKEINLNKVFTNKNYLTGKSCDEEIEFKTFQF